VRNRVALEKCARREGERDPGHGSMLPIRRVGSAAGQRFPPRSMTTARIQTRHLHGRVVHIRRAAFEGTCLLEAAAFRT
jgi:hypothetical protein